MEYWITGYLLSFRRSLFFFQLRSLFMVACETEVLRAIWDLYLLDADPFLVFFLMLVMVINGRWGVLGIPCKVHQTYM